MKSLETFTGGHPLQIDDLKHMQAAYVELFQMFGAWGSQDASPRIVTGCNITGSIPSRSVSAGWVWWNGEFYYVPAGTVAGSHVYIVCIPNTTYLPPSPVVYANASSHNCHRYNYMTLGSTSTLGLPTVGYLSLMPRFGVEPWTSVSTYSAGYANDGSGIWHNCGFRKNSLGQLELRGAVKTNAVPGGTEAFTLPAGFRPTKTIRVTTSTSSAVAFIDINQLGEVHIFPQIVAANVTTFFDGIRIDLS